MYELPPANFASPSPPPRVSVTPRLGIFIMMWVALVGGYAAYRWLRNPPNPEPVTPKILTTTAAIPAEWGRYVASLDADALQAEPNLRHAEDEIRRTLALTDNFAEARHLHAALASLEATHQSLVRSRHDIEILEVLLKGDKPQ